VRSHRGIVHPPATIIARATRTNRALGKPPFNGLVRGFLALLAFCYSVRYMSMLIQVTLLQLCELLLKLAVQK
jgi:hypothetical protein